MSKVKRPLLIVVGGCLGVLASILLASWQAGEFIGLATSNALLILGMPLGAGIAHVFGAQTQ